MRGSAGFEMALSNILARSTIACCWASPNWTNMAAGAGLMRASVRARSATMAASTKDVFGTGHWCGKNCTVLAVRSALSLEHIVGSSDGVWDQDLNTSCRPHGGPKCGSQRSSKILGLLFLEVRGGFNLNRKRN